MRLAPKTFVIGEVARSDAAGTLGDAARVELRHSSGNTDARVYYNWSEGTFSNATASQGSGATAIGLTRTDLPHGATHSPSAAA